MTLFPNVTPSDREFEDGLYYLATQQFRLGGSFRKQYGQLLQEASLSLTFENVDDAIAAAFVDACESASGGLLPVELPVGFLEGMGAQLKAIASSSGSWYIADAVQVRSQQPGVSTVRLELVADSPFAIAIANRPESSDQVLFGTNPTLSFRVRLYFSAQPVEYRLNRSLPVELFLIGDSVEYAVSSSLPVQEYDQGDSVEYAVSSSLPVQEYDTGQF